MKYPFYLVENLTAAAMERDDRAFANLVERNFTVIMNDAGQTATVRWLRVAQLVSLITRAALRAGGRSQELFALSQLYLERLSRIPVNARTQMRELLLEFSNEVLEQLPSPLQAQSTLLRRFLELLGAADFQQVSVNELAQSLGVTASHLCRAVKAQTGRTPIEHIRVTKLTHARNLLNNNSVTRAAIDSGFGKVSTLISLFRREYGETPGRYKRRLTQTNSSGEFQPRSKATDQEARSESNFSCR